MITNKNIISINDSYESFIITKKALADLKDKLLVKNNPQKDSILIKYYLMSYGKLNEYFANEITEHSMIYSFKMIATTEAILRIDYDKRIKNRYKDNLSRDFRSINNTYQNGVPLNITIDLWVQNYPSAKKHFSEFRRILNERHWIAHGRYWILKSGKIHDLLDVFLTCQSIINLINATAHNTA